MKLILEIEGKKADVIGINYVTRDLYRRQLLIRNAIEKLKLENEWKMRGKNWQIFMSIKSQL